MKWAQYGGSVGNRQRVLVGFIPRYPPDKAEITGCANEPWQLRYVGAELAAAPHASGLTTEELSGWRRDIAAGTQIVWRPRGSPAASQQQTWMMAGIVAVLASPRYTGQQV
jgi:hypothetical protein